MAGSRHIHGAGADLLVVDLEAVNRSVTETERKARWRSSERDEEESGLGRLLCAGMRWVIGRVPNDPAPLCAPWRGAFGGLVFHDPSFVQSNKY